MFLNPELPIQVAVSFNFVPTAAQKTMLGKHDRLDGLGNVHVTDGQAAVRCAYLADDGAVLAGFTLTNGGAWISEFGTNSRDGGVTDLLLIITW